MIRGNSGSSTIQTTEITNDSNIKRNMVKNELKQNLLNYTEHRSFNKSAGDCLSELVKCI